MTTRSRQSRRSSSGFSLVELLVTIGIIAVLISILIPTISAVRKSAQDADTRSLLAAISASVSAYQQDYSAFPGPLSQEQLYARDPDDTGRLPSIGSGASAKEMSANFGMIDSFVDGTADTGGGKNITGSENLLLGLSGGVRVFSTANGIPIGINEWGYDPASVGGGPKSLNAANPKTPRSASYFDAKPSDIYKPGQANGGRFTDANGNAANDSAIPEYLDRYSDQLPILYLRARKGATGIMSDNGTNAPPSRPTSTGNFRAQYERDEIAGYIDSNIGAAGALGHGLRGISDSATAIFDGPIIAAGQNKKTYRIPYVVYFKDPAAPPLPAASNVPAKNLGTAPRQKDNFILISAGRDRIYGTIDDITNFGTFE